jgi:anhydro-N-acetylmuramic acid kinase
MSPSSSTTKMVVFVALFWAMGKEYLPGVQHLFGSLESGQAVVGGVLSGTSGDAIDVVLSRVRVEDARVTECVSLCFEARPFPGDLAQRVRAALDGVFLGPREIALLSRDLGRAFGQAAREVAQGAGLELDLLGSHGQTIYHHDGAELSGAASLQIGDGDHVAEEARCVVVSDFRQADLAAGGEGAPISVLADDAVFWRAARPLAILNLGGMANLSWIGADDTRLAFDTGPAGALLDGFSRRLIGVAYDRGGDRAAHGKVQLGWLRDWLEHPFFKVEGPKSTGRDTFGEAWVGQLLAAAGAQARPEDLLRTAVELVAQTVVDRLESALRGLESGFFEGDVPLWVAGGGQHNRCLMEALEARFGGPVCSSEGAGVDPDAREALVFAVLAARAILGQSVSGATATGARSGKILGKISQYGW